MGLLVVASIIVVSALAVLIPELIRRGEDATNHPEFSRWRVVRDLFRRTYPMPSYQLTWENAGCLWVAIIAMVALGAFLLYVGSFG